MTTPAKPLNFRIILALLTVQFLFGINYVVSKKIVDTVQPLVWADIRVIISAIGLFLIAIITRRPAPQLDKKFFLNIFLFSLLGVVINQGSFQVGLKYTSATNSAILNTLIPIFTLLIATVSGREKITLKKAAGFAFALTGVLVMRKVENFSLVNGSMMGDALIVLNCLSFALFLTFSKKFLEKIDPIWATAWLFAVGSITFTLIALPYWGQFTWPTLNASLVACMTYVIFGSTLLASLINIWVLSKAPASAVALFINVQPIIAGCLAWFWMGEIISTRSFFASLFIFFGMILGIT